MSKLSDKDLMELSSLRRKFYNLEGNEIYEIYFTLKKYNLLHLLEIFEKVADDIFDIGYNLGAADYEPKSERTKE